MGTRIRPSFRSFARLGDGHLLIQGAVRNANAELSVQRARFSLSPQAFEWEKLRAPVLLDDFAELRAHREAQPHVLLRPRSLCEDIHALPVDKVEGVLMDAESRRLMARLLDARGEALTLIQPFYFRGRPGFHRLREVLETEKVCFVSGIVRGSTIEPVAIVYQKDGRRHMLQPWIASTSNLPAAAWTESAAPTNALSAFREDAAASLGEAVLVGIAQGDAVMQKRWQALVDYGEQIGLERLLTPARRLASELAQRSASLAWNAEPTARAAVEFAICLTFGSVN